jgi:hypothetical protein
MLDTRPEQWSPARTVVRYQMDQRLVVRAGTTLHGRTKDISEIGLGATVAGELNLDQEVELEFFVTGSLTPFKLKAEVRYLQGFHCGFRFVNVTDQELSIIREAILYLQPVP